MKKKEFQKKIKIDSEPMRSESTATFWNSPDIEIWRQFKSGNESAFIHIYRTYFQKLYNLGMQFSNNSSLVKDCIQDLFIDIRRTRNKLSDTTSIKFYLFKAMRRRVIREIKVSQKGNLLHSLNESFNFQFSFSYEHQLITKQLSSEKIERLNKALEKLPKRQKEVIYHLFYEQLSYEEIKDLMDFSNVKSVRNKAYIALKTLRQSYE